MVEGDVDVGDFAAVWGELVEFELAGEVKAADCAEVAGWGDLEVVREVVFGHGEEAAVEEDEAGVGESGAVGGVEEVESGAGLEEEETGQAEVAVELADGFGEERAVEGAFLEEAAGEEPMNVQEGSINAG
ncbi:Glutamate-1-semialdehyde 2,1-aminomutase [Striga asiatica]|uniref:Glutamate-1-semialdehyde 2,1-aminomutase n=1 Tax=Striga asiatica TaxID=4170 RepID=A0A5A7QCD8_STRAF|nr:Glutamate-1-semialdehyde 2,1-aminomutase [Striga asiatica]